MMVYNDDCFKIMKDMANNSVDFTLTDIPYDGVARKVGTLSNLKNLATEETKNADTIDFDLNAFLDEVYRITKNSICIFCGRGQFSDIYNYFDTKPGTVRPVVYEKTNPVPSNGQYVYLSGVEFAVWFKKRGAKVFNAYCKNTVFRYPIFGGKTRTHPTQKHPGLFEELIRDNTNPGDTVFDPCAGGMTTARACLDIGGLDFICCELNKEFYDAGVKYLEDTYHVSCT